VALLRPPPRAAIYEKPAVRLPASGSGLNRQSIRFKIASKMRRAEGLYSECHRAELLESRGARTDTLIR